MGTQLNGSDNDDRQLFSGDIVAHTVESIVALDTEWCCALYFTRLLCVALMPVCQAYAIYWRSRRTAQHRSRAEPMSCVDRRCYASNTMLINRLINSKVNLHTRDCVQTETDSLAAGASLGIPQCETTKPVWHPLPLTLFEQGTYETGEISLRHYPFRASATCSELDPTIAKLREHNFFV